jgi:hypothetical protein
LELSLALPSALLPFNTFQEPASRLKLRLPFASTKSKFGCHPSQTRPLTQFKTATLLQRFMEVLFQYPLLYQSRFSRLWLQVWLRIFTLPILGYSRIFYRIRQGRLTTLYVIPYFYGFRENVNVVILRSCPLFKLAVAETQRCLVKIKMPLLAVGCRSLLT